MRFNEGIIVSGTIENDNTLIASGSAVIIGSLHISGSQQEGIRIGKGGSDYRQIVFETDGDDGAIIQLTNAENLAIFAEEDKDTIFYTKESSDGSYLERARIKNSGKVGIHTSSPIAELDVAGKIAISAEVSTPSQPANGQGYLYSKSDGKLYWRSYDVSETDLTAGAGGGGGGGSGDNLSVTSPKTGNYTASNWEFVLVNLAGASGDVTITLPTASADKQVAIKINSQAMGKEVIVDGNGSETIDGSATRIMNTDYESMHLISDGSAWWRIS